MAAIKPGFIGIATIDGDITPIIDCNVNLIQDVLFYDHIIGLRDSIPNDLFDGKGDNATENKQKKFYRPGVIIGSGNINYYLIENGHCSYDNAAKGEIIDIKMDYSCDISREFLECAINNYTFSATAGDLCNETIDIMCKEVVESGGFNLNANVKKLITWDEVHCDVNIDGIQSLTFTINNNCKAVYTAQGLEPKEIRFGMQEVYGSISYYNEGRDLNTVGNNEKITIEVGNESFELNVVFKPQGRVASVGPVISTIEFTGAIDR